MTPLDRKPHEQGIGQILYQFREEYISQRAKSALKIRCLCPPRLEIPKGV